MKNKLIITACICGAEVSKKQNPAVPYTVSEIQREALSAYNSGASVIHLHVRKDDGTPTQDIERFRECMDAIYCKCPDVIIQVSTGGSAEMRPSERISPLYLSPEMATLDCGTCNFGYDDIFVNTVKTVTEFANTMKERNIKPELEVFDKGMVDTVLALNSNNVIVSPMHFNFVMGVPGAMAATTANLDFMVSSIPPDCTWTASGIGKYQFQVAKYAAEHGGHIRVGLEDNIYLEKGILAPSNGHLVEKAVEIAHLHNRSVASPQEAREILGINKEGR